MARAASTACRGLSWPGFEGQPLRPERPPNPEKMSQINTTSLSFITEVECHSRFKKEEYLRRLFVVDGGCKNDNTSIFQKGFCKQCKSAVLGDAQADEEFCPQGKEGSAASAFSLFENEAAAILGSGLCCCCSAAAAAAAILKT